MPAAKLEHANLTVSDTKAAAALLCRLFHWKIRWEGPSRHNGYTVHVGSRRQYLALYTAPHVTLSAGQNHAAVGGLNHLAVEVQDLDATEARVKKAGLHPHNHADYDPGRRFYFHDPDGIEFEVVCYRTNRNPFAGWTENLLWSLIK